MAATTRPGMASARPPREWHESGTFYENDDVRINRLSLSLLILWKRPLPDVLTAPTRSRLFALGGPGGLY